MNRKNISQEMHQKLQILIDKGFYDNESEILREALRNHLQSYKEELDKSKIRDRLQVLLDTGFYDDSDEIVREAIRNHLIKYKVEMERSHAKG